MTSGTVIGSTGLVGSRILATLLGVPAVSTVHTIARRESKSTDSKLHVLIEANTSQWAVKFSAIQPSPSIFFSALGTTRGQAGGFDKQWAIDHDLNLEMAKAAKKSGVKVYVIISSSGADSGSMIPYTKMKGVLEDEVRALDFEHTVIVRPGLIVGSREDSRPPEAMMRGVANFVGGISNVLKDFWAQDADVIGRAAVSAGLQASEGKAPEKVWIVGQSDVVRLGRTEWKS